MPIDRLLSADSHVVEPPDVWTDRTAREYRDRAPKMVREIDGVVGDYFVCEELRPVSVSGFAVAGRDPRGYKESMYEGYAGVPNGAYDGAKRVEDQDVDGVAGEVLYPSYGMMLYGIDDGGLRTALFQAYNAWLAEYCSHAPNRLAGVALMPMDDVPTAVAEVERAAELGLKGGLIWGIPPEDRPYTDPSWEPFWDAAEDHRLPLSLHILTGRSGTGMQGLSTMRGYPFLPHAIERTMGDLIFGGVLERHPDLRIVSAENDIGWVAHFLQRMDHAYEKYQYLEREEYVPEPPSHYFRRQVTATFQDDRVGVLTRDFIGVDNLMWASDFPHSDSTWPASHAVVEKDFAGVPDDETRKIVADNCAALYGIG